MPLCRISLPSLTLHHLNLPPYITSIHPPPFSHHLYLPTSSHCLYCSPPIFTSPLSTHLPLTSLLTYLYPPVSSIHQPGIISVLPSPLTSPLPSPPLFTLPLSTRLLPHLNLPTSSSHHFCPPTSYIASIQPPPIASIHLVVYVYPPAYSSHRTLSTHLPLLTSSLTTHLLISHHLYHPTPHPHTTFICPPPPPAITSIHPPPPPAITSIHPPPPPAILLNSSSSHHLYPPIPPVINSICPPPLLTSPLFTHLP